MSPTRRQVTRADHPSRRLPFRRFGRWMGLLLCLQAVLLVALLAVLAQAAGPLSAAFYLSLAIGALFLAGVNLAWFGLRLMRQGVGPQVAATPPDQRSQQMADALRQALPRHELTLTYQPKVMLADGRLCGFEVLLRWNSPEHGDIGPAEFIPLAESSGLVVPIGLWALDQACAQLSRWQAAFPAARRITLAVNVSMRQLVLPDFDDRVKAILHKHGLAARSIEIELTETAAMQDPQQTIAVLGRLRQLGLRLALDDFGTGHSSLGWLQKLPIDILKIDKSFLPGLAGQAPDAAPATPPERNIVRPILALAHAMDLDTVAEGVETTEQWTRLETLGCKIGQGYIFSQSLSSDEAEKLLSNSADFFYPRTPE